MPRRVRTSTIVLAGVFLVTLALYILVRPTPSPAPTTVVPSEPPAATTSQPVTTTTQVTTTTGSVSTTTSTEPTSTPEPTTTSQPTTTTSNEP